MRNKKLTFIIGFIVGSLIFGFASQYISNFYYEQTHPGHDKDKYITISDFKGWKNKHSCKPWESK